MNRIAILGIEIDNLTIMDALNKIDELIKTGNPSIVVTANPEIIMLARKETSFRNQLEEAQLVTADGIGVVLAARILGRPLKQRVTGIDLVIALFEKAKSEKYRFYFVGAKPGVAEKAATNITSKYPWVEIVGISDGYFKDDTHIIKDIKEKKPDILLAALGMGKQEKWIKERVYTAGVPVSIGVGGCFDVFAGEAKRAPVWMQRAGLEWLYRLIKQPSRFIRMLALPKFLLKVIGDRIAGGE